MTDSPTRAATVREAAIYADVSEQTIRRRIRLGVLPAYRPAGVGRRTLVDLDDVDRLLAPRRVTA